jgi:diguanylate cyclase (GGDEF)-like protein
MIRQVLTPTGLLFSGHASLDAPARPRIAYDGNSLTFVYGAPFLEGVAQTEYTHRLEGFDRDWSPWQRENTTAYTNLREGRYDFRVRARTVYGDILDEAVYRFTVLPPWYRTGAAFFAFAAAVILGLFGAMRVNSRRLLEEKARLEQRIADQTRELREASLSDELTGLRNRRFVTEVVLTEFQAFTSFKQSLLRLAEKGRPLPERAGSVFACFLCDLDHFKRVNDEYGHETGDLVLKQVARLLTASAREDDYVIRWGGEEFLVVLKYTDPSYVPVFAEKVRRAVADAAFRRSDTAGQPLHLTISIGYSLFPFYEDSPRFLSFEHTVQLADLAMYAAKGRGRNQAVGVGRGSVRLPDAEVESCLADLSGGLARGYLSVTPEGR